MLYFKKIEIEVYHEIIEGALAYLKIEAPDIYNRTRNTTYYPLNLGKLIEYCPKLESAFDKYSLKCNMAVEYVMYNNIHSTIHVDKFYHDARINIPLLNCTGTKTLFFNGGEYEIVHNPLTQTNAKKLKSTHGLQFKTSVEIDGPTVVRVNEPHTVVMVAKNSPRITLSLGFDKDPVFLLED
jgi:hypothetical protein